MIDIVILVICIWAVLVESWLWPSGDYDDKNNHDDHDHDNEKVEFGDPGHKDHMMMKVIIVMMVTKLITMTMMTIIMRKLKLLTPVMKIACAVALNSFLSHTSSQSITALIIITIVINIKMTITIIVILIMTTMTTMMMTCSQRSWCQKPSHVHSW